MAYADRRDLIPEWLPLFDPLISGEATAVTLVPTPPMTPQALRNTMYELLYTVSVLAIRPDPKYAAQQEQIEKLAAIRPNLRLRFNPDTANIDVLDKRAYPVGKGRQMAAPQPATAHAPSPRAAPNSGKRFTPEHALSQLGTLPEIKLEGSMGESDLNLLRKLAAEQQVVVMGRPDESPIILATRRKLLEDGYDERTINELMNVQTGDSDDPFAAIAKGDRTSTQRSSAEEA